MLGKAHGGEADVEKGAFCKFFKFRPRKIRGLVLCSGSDCWDACPDFETCKTLPSNDPFSPEVLFAHITKSIAAHAKKAAEEGGNDSF